MNRLMLLAAIGLAGMAAPTMAQTGCEITELSAASKAVDYYLKAENKLLLENDPESTLMHLKEMQKLDLDCLEESIALGLSAQAKIAVKDYRGAISDLQLSLEKNYIPAGKEAHFLLTISQLYFLEKDRRNGLIYMNRWLDAGGKPSRNQMHKLARVNYDLGNYADAILWLEKVYEIDGSFTKMEDYDFLSVLYMSTGNFEKQIPILLDGLEKYPDNEAAWKALALAYDRTGQIEKKADLLEALAVRYPDDVFYWDVLARQWSFDPEVIRLPSIAADREAKQSAEGSQSCVMSFDTNPSGKPVNIQSKCTVIEIEEDAKRALSEAQFVPKFVDGSPVERRGMEYVLKVDEP